MFNPRKYFIVPFFGEYELVHDTPFLPKLSFNTITSVLLLVAVQRYKQKSKDSIAYIWTF